jgi:hypothetical protein
MPQEGLLQRTIAGRNLLNSTASLLERCSFKLVRTRIVVFVCGGTPKIKDGEPPSWRAAFLEWMKIHDDSSRLEVFLAEKAYDAAVKQDSKFLNISEFEQMLAALSDCILLFPESAGSYAEAGVFSSSHDILSKVLVANEIDYHNASSFLNLGPLHTFTSLSRFSQAVILAGAEKINNAAFPIIRQRIENNALKNRTTINWASAKDVDIREKLAVVLALIRTAGLLSAEDLLDLLAKISLEISMLELNQLLRILRTFKQIECQSSGVFRFIEATAFEATIAGAERKLTGLSASYRNYYLQNFPRLLDSQAEMSAE